MTQLVELQRVMPALVEADVALFSISYDPVEVLAAFATREGIEFPMLSDVGSTVITSLGLRNDRVHEQHAVFGFKANPRNEGVPYPGAFALDETGTVVARRFFDLYRERETGPGLIERALGLDVAIDGPASVAGAGAARVEVRLDSSSYKSHQRIWLYVEIDLEPGAHVFAVGTAAPYRGLEIEIDPIEGVSVGAAEWPDPEPFRLAGISQDLAVHHGALRGALPLRVFVPAGSGDLTVTGRVHLQVCTAASCDLPGTVEFTLPLPEGRFVRPG